MGGYPTVRAIMFPRRLKPAGYICELGERRLFIPGHYEINNGGIDTIKDLDMVYGLILIVHEFGADVLYEGQNMADGTDRLMMMHKAQLDIRVLFLNHPLDACIRAVQERGHSIKTGTITAIYNKCARQQKQLQHAGILCATVSRAEACPQIQQWLGSPR